MLTGRVTADLEPLLRLIVRGARRELQIETVVDTGFNGFLMLPPRAIESLGLRYNSDGIAELADGSFVSTRRFEGLVLWEDGERRIIVDEAAGGALLGMSLLKGYHLGVDACDAGRVTIEPLEV